MQSVFDAQIISIFGFSFLQIQSRKMYVLIFPSIERIKSYFYTSWLEPKLSVTLVIWGFLKESTNGNKLNLKSTQMPESHKGTLRKGFG